MIYKNISDAGKVKYLNVFIEMNEQAKQQVLELMQINIDSQEQLRWVYKLFWIKNDIVDGYHYIKNYSKQENLEIPVDYNYEKLLQEIEAKYDFFSLNDSYQSYLSLNARLKYSMANHLTDKSDFKQAIDIYKNIADMLEKAITLKPKDISYKIRQIKALYKVAISYEAIQDYDNALNYITKTVARLESLKRHGLLPKRVEIWLKKDIKLQRRYEQKIIEAAQ
jgi:tetratricopeptide (TPR) repeat protein